LSDQFTRASSFDLFEYFVYLRTRWKFVFASCFAAAILAAAISLILPKRYTATASILIDAPAGNDPRAATAVSPVYLESLKTYERFADSDTLFVRAVQRFGLREEEASSAAVDSLKRQLLKVTKLRDTKALEISVTLRDPTKAQAVAQFIAEETVKLNHSLSRQSDDELIEQSRGQVDLARAKLDEAEKLLNQESARSPVESVQSEMRGLVDLKERWQRELVEANADIADYKAQLKVQSQATADSDRLLRDLAGVSARAEVLRKELDSVSRSILQKETEVARRTARLDRLAADRQSARVVYDSALARWNDAQGSVGNRGERLKIIDPGIVPQRPSFPNLTLNIMAAILISMVAALLYISMSFVAESRGKADAHRIAYR
jgi:capsule polysaccharide export protein KpsE/RkpR